MEDAICQSTVPEDYPLSEFIENLYMQVRPPEEKKAILLRSRRKLKEVLHWVYKQSKATPDMK